LDTHNVGDRLTPLSNNIVRLQSDIIDGKRAVSAWAVAGATQPESQTKISSFLLPYGTRVGGLA